MLGSLFAFASSRYDCLWAATAPCSCEVKPQEQ